MIKEPGGGWEREGRREGDNVVSKRELIYTG